MRVRLLSLLAALATVLAVAAAPASAAELGLNVAGGPAGDVGDVIDTGATWGRHFAFTDVDPSAFRDLVEKEEAAGKKTLLTVVNTPRTNHDPAAYAEYLTRLVRATGGKVDAIEVWNEQDEPLWWGTTPDPGAYVNLLRAAHGAIKAADPDATVVFGPLTGNNYEYLQAAYAAGAKGFFDAVGVHTDTACLTNGPTDYYRDRGEIARFTFLGYRTVRKVMLANGDDKPIWMTEFGWSTANHVCEFGESAGKKPAGVSAAQQAQFLSEAVHCLKEDPYVTVAMWFGNRDTAADGKMENSYGLRDAAGNPKPAYEAFRAATRGEDPVVGTCGDFTAPRVEIQAPAPGFVFGEADPLELRARTPDTDVLRLTLAVDGAANEIRNFTNSGNPLSANTSFGLTWQGARQLPFGQHTVIATAIDRAGNVGEARVTVQRVAPQAVRPITPAFAGLQLKKLKTRKGRKPTYTLKGRLTAPVNFQIGGKVLAEWQNQRKGKFKKIHGGSKNANAPFTFRQTLKYKGRWRVRLVYEGKAPFLKTTSRWTSFRVR